MKVASNHHCFLLLGFLGTILWGVPRGVAGGVVTIDGNDAAMAETEGFRAFADKFRRRPIKRRVEDWYGFLMDPTASSLRRYGRPQGGAAQESVASNMLRQLYYLEHVQLATPEGTRAWVEAGGFQLLAALVSRPILASALLQEALVRSLFVVEAPNHPAEDPLRRQNDAVEEILTRALVCLEKLEHEDKAFYLTHPMTLGKPSNQNNKNEDTAPPAITTTVVQLLQDELTHTLELTDRLERQALEEDSGDPPQHRANRELVRNKLLVLLGCLSTVLTEHDRVLVYFVLAGGMEILQSIGFVLCELVVSNGGEISGLRDPKVILTIVLDLVAKIDSGTRASLSSFDGQVVRRSLTTEAWCRTAGLAFVIDNGAEAVHSLKALKVLGALAPACVETHGVGVFSHTEKLVSAVASFRRLWFRACADSATTRQALCDEIRRTVGVVEAALSTTPGDDP